LLENALHGASLSPADRGPLQEITYGVSAAGPTLDWLIAGNQRAGTKTGPAKFAAARPLPDILAPTGSADHAAVHETVELEGQTVLAPAGFVKRPFCAATCASRTKPKLLAGLKISTAALGWSHPDGWVARWQKRCGHRKTAAAFGMEQHAAENLRARQHTSSLAELTGRGCGRKTSPVSAGTNRRCREYPKPLAAGCCAHSRARLKIQTGDLLARWREEKMSNTTSSGETGWRKTWLF